jgi:ATP-dependent Lhr-like helicase
MESDEIKKRLKRAWHPFFSRFGKLTEVQEKTIPLVLEGKNLLVISPAATGKTEAVIAPLCELFCDHSTNSTIILYISPTRALVNDVMRRLNDPVEMMGLSIGRRTGERKEITSKSKPFLLITTPESLDSIMARTPALLEDVKAVVIDEVHLIDGTERGDMVRVLLKRLKLLLKGKKVLTFALSATVDRPELGARYMDNYETVVVKKKREINRFFFRDSPETPSLLVKFLAENQFKKCIAFFNSRSLAESFSARFSLPPFTNSVLVHHGSLSKSMREEAESFMLTGKAGIICATTTLELGIDIGDIDCVILYRPPPSISSLLQRIGRGNRRRNDSLTAVGIYTNEWERLLFETFFECAEKGEFYERRYREAIAAIPQQVFSYLYQKRRTGATRKSIQRIFEGIYSSEDVDRFIEHAIMKNYLREMRMGILAPSEKLENLIRYGKIHSTIKDLSSKEYEIVEAETGRRIGSVFYVPSSFSLGGRIWNLVELDRKNRIAYVRSGEEVESAYLFEGVGFGNYSYELSGVLRRKIFPEVNMNSIPFTIQNGEAVVFHLFGPIYGSLLSESLEMEKRIKTRCIDGKVTFCPSPDIMLSPSEEVVREVIRNDIATLQDALGAGNFFYNLPEELQVKAIWNSLDMDGFLEYLHTLEFVEYEREDFMERIKRVIEKL